MKFSKRPQPMNFGGPEEEPHDEPATPAYDETPAYEPEPVGFRPLDASGQDYFMAIHGRSTNLTRQETPAEAYAAAFDIDRPAPSGWPTWVIALGVALLWAAGPIAFAIGYRAKVAPLQDDQFAMAVFALLAIGPAIFVLGCAYMIRQGQKLAFEARRAKAMAQDMLSPALLAACAGDVATPCAARSSAPGRRPQARER